MQKLKCVAGWPVWRDPEAPQHSLKLFQPANRSSLKWLDKPRFYAGQHQGISSFHLPIFFRMRDRHNVKPDPLLFTKPSKGSYNKVCVVIRDDVVRIAISHNNVL
jgi:hypothetical protein